MVPPPREPGVLELGHPAVEHVEHHVLEGVAAGGRMVKNMSPRLRELAKGSLNLGTTFLTALIIVPVECDLVAHQPPHVEHHAAGHPQLGGVVGAVPEVPK